MSCGQCKQISGSKSWIGYAGFINYPGWADIWDATHYPEAWAGSSGGNFTAGQLVLYKKPGFTGTYGRVYPPLHFPFICIADVTGASDPETDPTHFARWSYVQTGFPAGGPSDWPLGMASGYAYDGMSNRIMWADQTRAYMQVTVQSVFANCNPGTSPLPYVNASVTPLITIDNGSLTDTWTLASHFATGATHSPASSGDTPQSELCFPNVPRSYAWLHDSGYLDEGYPLSGTQSGGFPIMEPAYAAILTAGLVSWNFTATSLQFEFGLWPLNTCPALPSGNNPWPGADPPAATVTQTITVSPPEYAIGDVQTEANALLSGTNAGPFTSGTYDEQSSGPTFDSLPWNTSAVCTYDNDGKVRIQLSPIPATLPTSSLGSNVCGSGLGSTVAWANGSTWREYSLPHCTWIVSKAQVDICGKYFVKTFYCTRSPIVVDCSDGTVDGYAPVEMDSPSFDPTQDTDVVYTYLFPNCQCSP